MTNDKALTGTLVNNIYIWKYQNSLTHKSLGQSLKCPNTSKSKDIPGEWGTVLTLPSPKIHNIYTVEWGELGRFSEKVEFSTKKYLGCVS